ncbi:MAG: ATP-binding protein, partial [Desulfosarcinaceae bacterium]
NALEKQLLQAQKMEFVGRLAGGIAHDYNNMLSIIMGYTEMALEKAAPGSPLQADLHEVLVASKRSADITRQLLAFARRQTIAPKVLGLNDTVASLLKMIRRLIGEDIDLAWVPGSNLRPIRIDPGQIDQILANLCVNARDAIDGVGKITIETRNIDFDKAYCADHAGFIPGEYALLAVSDDGSGMSPEVMKEIFEPFFTTKDVGKGTGLGLSTVYGIVKQNNGFINVYSEPGKGTTVRIYLPRHSGSFSEARRGPDREAPTSRGETVLLVEDDQSILKLGIAMLERLGYTVLTANAPAKAVALARAHPGRIHLLITDVVMPGMNGRDLADQLQVLFPDLKVLFMSGYTSDVIAHRGVLEEGVHFIAKPFSRQELAFKVREVLDNKS